ncbi:unnamed protein product [marine sediment metagenome]|uniref:Uncharacterized protein n=1 Tax=marine sediment metagenome TaxID=412755 RepID=X0RHE9_9ZZZZ
MTEETTKPEAKQELGGRVDSVVMRRVVCAACLSKCGNHIVLGPRHWDSLMRTAAALMSEPDGTSIKWTGGAQGFVDQHRNYISRKEAWKVAKSAGQIVRRCGGDDMYGGYLFSENLY